MKTQNRRIVRHVPYLSHDLTGKDLITLEEAMRLLTNWHKRPYTLADIQLLNVEGNNTFTPVFYYEGNAIDMSSQTMSYQDWVKIKSALGKIIKIRAILPRRFIYISGWFNLDLRVLKNSQLGNFVDFTKYKRSPNIKINPIGMVQITKIMDDYVTHSNTFYMPIKELQIAPDTFPITNKLKPLKITLDNWRIPIKQIERLHPDYKIIYMVYDKYYIFDNSNAGLYADATPIDIAGLDARFYTLITNTDLMPYSMQILAGKGNIETSQPRQPIDPATIGHNSKISEKKAKVSNTAKQIWQNDDLNQEIRTGDMCKIIRLILEPHISLPTDPNLKKYFKDVAPDYAKKKGANALNKNKIINQIVAKYS